MNTHLVDAVEITGYFFSLIISESGDKIYQVMFKGDKWVHRLDLTIDPWTPGLPKDLDSYTFESALKVHLLETIVAFYSIGVNILGEEEIINAIQANKRFITQLKEKLSEILRPKPSLKVVRD